MLYEDKHQMYQALVDDRKILLMMLKATLSNYLILLSGQSLVEKLVAIHLICKGSLSGFRI